MQGRAVWDHVNKPTNDKLSEKGAATMKLTTNTQVSVDGVVQGNGGPEEEDLRRGFERGGWARPLFDNQALMVVNEFYQPPDALLVRRRTYELLARHRGD